MSRVRHNKCKHCLIKCNKVKCSFYSAVFSSLDRSKRFQTLFVWYEPHYLKTEIDTVFQFQQVDENDILNIINNITPKTSSGIDNLSIKHIKVIKNRLL